MFTVTRRFFVVGVSIRFDFFAIQTPTVVYSCLLFASAVRGFFFVKIECSFIFLRTIFFFLSMKANKFLSIARTCIAQIHCDASRVRHGRTKVSSIVLQINTCRSVGLSFVWTALATVCRNFVSFSFDFLAQHTHNGILKYCQIILFA